MFLVLLQISAFCTLTVQIGVVLLTDELVVVPEVNSVPSLQGAVTKCALKARFVVHAAKDPPHDFRRGQILGTPCTVRSVKSANIAIHCTFKFLTIN